MYPRSDALVGKVHRRPFTVSHAHERVRVHAPTAVYSHLSAPTTAFLRTCPPDSDVNIRYSVLEYANAQNAKRTGGGRQDPHVGSPAAHPMRGTNTEARASSTPRGRSSRRRVCLCSCEQDRRGVSHSTALKGGSRGSGTLRLVS